MTSYTKRKNQLKRRILRKQTRIAFLRGLDCVTDDKGNKLYNKPPTNLVTATTWDGVLKEAEMLAAEVVVLSDKLDAHLSTRVEN